MPIPPDYEPSKKPATVNLPKASDWMILLAIGIICVLLSDGDLEAIGNQLVGAGLAAFRFIIKSRNGKIDEE
jgi:hypothetical protein